MLEDIQFEYVYVCVFNMCMYVLAYILVTN